MVTAKLRNRYLSFCPLIGPKATLFVSINNLKWSIAMARINFEDSLYSDIRFINLISKCGSLEFALGSLIRAWGLGQKYYLNEETNRMIPLKKWNQQGIKMDIIEVGLAEIIDDHVYIKGAEKQFAWLLRQRAAGVASHKARSAHGVKNPTVVEPPSTDVEVWRSSYSYSPSSSNSISNTVDVVLIQTPPENKFVKENTLESNSVQRFEDSYKPEVLEFKKIIDQFEITSMPSLKRIVPDIAKGFNYKTQDFKDWCESAINSKAMKNIDNNNDRARYFVAAIKREIGLTK